MTVLPSAEGTFWNPASLATVTRNTVLFYHGNHLTGNATGLSGLFSRDGTGTLGVSYNLLDESGIVLTDETGLRVGSVAVRGDQGIASVASPFEEWLNVGLNLKLVGSGVTCRGQCPEGNGPIDQVCGGRRCADSTGQQACPRLRPDASAPRPEVSSVEYRPTRATSLENSSRRVVRPNPVRYRGRIRRSSHVRDLGSASGSGNSLNPHRG